MPDTIQVVRVEDLQRLYSTETVDGTLYAIGGDLDAPYLIGDVIELTEEAEEFDDENDRWLRTFSSPIESDHDDA